MDSTNKIAIMYYVWVHHACMNGRLQTVENAGLLMVTQKWNSEVLCRVRIYRQSTTSVCHDM